MQLSFHRRMQILNTGYSSKIKVNLNLKCRSVKAVLLMRKEKNFSMKERSKED